MEADDRTTLFWENEDGVHFEGPIPEYMLCGDAFEGDALKHGSEFGEMKPTEKRTVTCPNCIEAIEYLRKHLKGLRTKKDVNV